MESVSQQTVVSSFKQLVESLDGLKQCVLIDDANLPVYTPLADSPDEARYKIAQHIQDIWYSSSTIVGPHMLPGLVAASNKTIDQLVEVNKAKADFKSLILKLRTRCKKGAKLKQIIGAADQRDEDVNLVLEASGMRGINLTLCYRKLYLFENLRSVSWTWAYSGRKVVPITHSQALLLVQDTVKTEYQDVAYQRILDLPIKTPMAVAKAIPNKPLANLTYFQDKINQPSQVPAHSPFFYRHNGHLPLVQWREKKKKEERPVKIPRSNRQLEDEPYVDAMCLYLYKDTANKKCSVEN